MDAPSGDAESADLVDLSKEDSSDKGKKRSSTTEFEPSAVKRVKLSHHDPASSRSSSPGRPQNTFWPFFDKSEQRKNSVHYWAYCKACTLAGRRQNGGSLTCKADSMQARLIRCDHVSEEVKQWARDWSKDSPAFVGSDDSSFQDRPQQQSKLGKFMHLKDAPMIAEEHQQFHKLLLKGTVSANLPFTWIDNEYIQEAFTHGMSRDRAAIQKAAGRYASMFVCSCIFTNV